MEWLKELLSGEAPTETKDKTDSNGLNEEAMCVAFEEGQDAAGDFLKLLIEVGRKYIDSGDPEAASVLIFTAVWRAVGLAKVGVEMSRKVHGEDSPVVDLWDGLRACLVEATEEEGIKALKAWHKAKGRGDL